VYDTIMRIREKMFQYC